MSTSPFPNPPTDFNVLVQPTTGAIVLAVIINALVTMGIRADLWPKEGVAISCMTVLANLFAAAINNTIIPAIQSGLLPLSTGNWLAWLALYVYGVNKVTAQFATGQLKLTNNGGGSFSLAPFAATFQDAVTLQTYTNTTAISLAPGPGTIQTINIQANVAGTVGNANPGDISIIQTTMLGVVCTNLAPVLGVDDQSDPSLRLECWNAIAANSPFGPQQSFAYAVDTAVNSVSGLPVNINRFQSSESSHTGTVTIWVAAPSGVPLSTDVIGVQNNILAIARPPCVTPTTVAVTTVADTDTITVYVTGTPGLVSSDVQTAIANALSDFFATYPIGGKTNGITQGLYATALDGVCFGAWPGVFDVTGTNDLVLTDGQVAVDSTTVIVRIV